MPASQIVKLNAFQIRQSVRTANFPSLISWHISAVIGVHSRPFQLSWFLRSFLDLVFWFFRSFLAFWLVWHYHLPLLISLTFIFLFRVSVWVKKFQFSGKNLPSLLKLSLSPPRVALRIKQIGKPPAPTYYKTRSFLEKKYTKADINKFKQNLGDSDSILPKSCKKEVQQKQATLSHEEGDQNLNPLSSLSNIQYLLCTSTNKPLNHLRLASLNLSPNCSTSTSRLSSTSTLLSLPITMSSVNVIVHGESCPASSVNQSITIANKKDLRADPWCNTTLTLNQSVTLTAFLTTVSLSSYMSSTTVKYFYATPDFLIQKL